MQQCALQTEFKGHELFTDEETFSSEDAFDAHNSHAFVIDYPHAMQPHAY